MLSYFWKEYKKSTFVIGNAPYSLGQNSRGLFNLSLLSLKYQLLLLLSFLLLSLECPYSLSPYQV